MNQLGKWCPKRECQLQEEVCKNEILNKNCNREHCPRYPVNLRRGGDNPGSDNGV